MASEPQNGTRPVEPAYGSARALVDALHQGRPEARQQLRHWLIEPVRRLMEELRRRYHLEHRLERLIEHSLHAAETYLRTRPAAQFDTVSLDALRAALVLQVAKQAVQPFGGARPPTANGGRGLIHMPDPLPEHASYHARTYFRPYEKVGSFWFGGDWYGGHLSEDGSLWLIVADITGHGYYAYLLAHTLPGVWQACWREEGGDRQPSDVLASMHELLARCLPEGVYVECTLLRLGPDGAVTIAPAGGSRLLIRQAKAQELVLLRLRGLWLGLDRPREDDQHLCTLAVGDELLIGSDGVFEQLMDHLGAPSDLPRLLADFLDRGSLLDAVARALQEALDHAPQKDDITMVAVHRMKA